MVKVLSSMFLLAFIVFLFCQILNRIKVGASQKLGLSILGRVEVIESIATILCICTGALLSVSILIDL